MTIRSEFVSATLNAQGIEKVTKVREAFSALLDVVEESTREGGDHRSLAIVRTKLEEASFYAVKAVALALVNQEVKP